MEAAPPFDKPSKKQRHKRNRRRPFSERDRVTLNIGRDPQILEFIAIWQPVTTSHITSFGFGSKSTCNHRMRKLFESGLVDAHVFHLSSENVYTLGKKGKEFLLHNTSLLPEDIRGLKRQSLEYLRHHFHLVDCYLATIKALDELPGVRLEFFTPEWKIRSLWTTQLLPIVPDGLFQVSWERRGTVETFLFAVEIDEGTESPTYFGKTKITNGYLQMKNQYAPLYGYPPPWNVLVFCPSFKRVKALMREALKRRVEDDLIRFTTFDSLSDETFFEKIYLESQELSQDESEWKWSTIFG